MRRWRPEVLLFPTIFSGSVYATGYAVGSAEGAKGPAFSAIAKCSRVEERVVYGKAP